MALASLSSVHVEKAILYILLLCHFRLQLSHKILQTYLGNIGDIIILWIC